MLVIFYEADFWLLASSVVNLDPRVLMKLSTGIFVEFTKLTEFWIIGLLDCWIGPPWLQFQILHDLHSA